MQEVGQNDAMICRDRALSALTEAEDVATRVSLWRLALRFNGKMKLAGESGDYAPSRLPLRARGATPFDAREAF